MWQNYWTVAVRALAKNRTYSIINVLGLAIGMAACIMILLYIRYEESYDSWIPGVENTYQLQAWYPHPSSGDAEFLQMSSYVTKSAAMKDFPQIEGGVYALSSQPVFVKDGQASPTKDYLIADDDFLKTDGSRHADRSEEPLRNRSGRGANDEPHLEGRHARFPDHWSP
jgi:putative ABC transport system permease protein